MENIAIITSVRAPYRILQAEHFAKKNNIKVDIYYMDNNYKGHKWKINKSNIINEYFLNGIKLMDLIYINWGLIKVIKKYDLIMLGGYEQPTYMLANILCKIMSKKCVLIFDGISPKKLQLPKGGRLYNIKKLLINNFDAIMANGSAGKRYFTEIFNYPKERVFEQYLTVDIDKIFSLENKKNEFLRDLKNKYDIEKNNKRIIAYSGRLIGLKRVEDIIKAISKLENKEKYLLLLIGDGEERKNIEELAKKLEVEIVITGFIENQDKLFEHYYIPDVLVFPSENDVWGLVVNEAMAAGLPIISSNACGVSEDLVKNNINGFVYECGDTNELKECIDKVFDNLDIYKKNSKEMIKEWSFDNSAKSLKAVVNYLS